MGHASRTLLTTTCLTAAMLCALPMAAFANPQGGTVSAGQASISEAGKKLDIHQQSAKTVIDWRGFDIAPDEQTEFHQPGSDSIALNRVNSNSASRIDGQLTANGNVVIVNQNGVLFGQNAKVDVNGLVATTADIDDGKFMNDNTLEFDKPGKPEAAIINEGSITAKEAGLVGLVAPNVINSGTITAKLGRVHLASGDTATVDMYGDGLMNVAVTDSVKSQLVSNSGIIDADGGTIALTAAAGKEIVNSLIAQTGALQARSVGVRNGKIIIAAEGSNAVAGNVAANKGKKTGSSTVLVRGVIDASGRKQGEKGGKITVTGDHVALLDGTLIDASGDIGGGTIKIGGDYLGGGDTPTAMNLYVDPGVLVLNDALNSGDAGRTIFWSDGTTQFYGSVYARALGAHGNGGFVETSGKNTLNVRGSHVDLTANSGNLGTWLLDPADISILNRSQVGDGTNSFTTADLETMSVGANVSLVATNNITLDLATDTMNFSTSGRSLTLNAGNQITTASTGSIITNGGAISFTGTNGIVFNNDFSLDAGSSTITLANILSGTGALSLTMGSGTTNISGAIGGLTKAGAGTLGQSGTLDVNGNFVINAGTFNISNRNLLIQGDFTLASGTTFTKGSQALTFDGTGSLTDNNATKQDLGTVVIGGTTTTRTLGSDSKMSALNINAGNVFSLNGYNLTRATSGAVSNNGTFRLQGGETLTNITNLGTAAGTVEYTGDGDGLADSYTIKDFGATDYYNLTINATDGTNDTFALGSALTFGTGGAFTMTNGTYDFGSQTITTTGDWTYNAGTVNAGTSTVVFGDLLGAGKAITGSHTLNNVTFANGGHNTPWNIASGTTLTALGTLTLSNPGGSPTINIGTLAAQGNINIADSKGWSGTATLLINGTGDQTFTGNATASSGTLPNININKASGTLTLAGTIRTLNDWTYTAGTVDAGTSTVVFGDLSGAGKAITGSHTLNNVTFSNNGHNTPWNIASGTTLTALGTLTLSNPAGNPTINTGTLAAQGNVVVSGVGSYGGTATLLFSGSNNQSFDLTGATNKLDLNTTINKASGTVTLLSDFIMDKAGQDLAISSGTFDLNGYNLTVNDQFTLGAAGTLALQGGETLNKAPTISAGGTVLYNGTGGAYTLKNWSYSNLTIAGGAASVFTQPANLSGINNLTITSGILSQGGFNLAATTLSNDGTLRLRGNETLTLTTMDTDSGTVEYTGDGDGLADSYTIKDFGATDYYNLKISATDGSLDTFGIASALRLGGALTHTAGTLNLGANVTTAGGAISSSGPLVLTANSVLDTTDGGGIPAGANVSFNTVNGAYNLTANANSFTFGADIGGTTPLAAVSLTSVNGMALPSINAASIFAQTTGAGGDITIPNNKTLTASGAGNALVLAAGRNFINNYNASALALSGGGRWIIYSTQSSADTAGGLSAAQTINSQTYGSLAPSGITAPTYNAGQNTWVYSTAPSGTLTFTAAGFSRSYGSVNPTFTYSFACSSGCTELDAVTGAPTLSTAAGQYSSVAGGPYAITIGMGTLAKTGSYSGYSINLVNGLLTILQKAVDIAGLTGVNKTYDRTTTADLSGSASLTGVVNSDDVSLSGTAGGTFADKNVGTAKTVTVNGLSLAGAAAGNYSLNSYQTTADITPASLIVIGVSGTNKVYDATTADSITGAASLSGVIGGDTVNLDTGSASASFADKNVGAGKSVTFTGYALAAGGDSGNYSLSQPTNSTADITAKALSVIGVSGTNKVYDATTADSITGIASLSGVIGGDTVNLDTSSAAAAFANKNVGTAKVVNFSGYALTAGGDAGNYSLSQPATSTADITAKALSVIGVSGSNKVYDATTADSITGVASLSGVIGGDTVNLDTSSAAAAFADKNVGTAKIVNFSGYALTAGGDAGNYSLSQPATGTADITPASLIVIGVSGTNKVYDATTADSITGAASLSGVIGGDTVNLDTGSASASFADKNVGAGKSVTFTGYALAAGGDSGNYSLSQPTNSTADITAKTLLITADAKSKTYGGVDAALTYGYSGLLSSDSITGNLLRAGGENVASYAIGQGTLDAGLNYTISYSGASFTINPATLSVTADAKSKTYGAADPSLSYGYAGLVNGDTSGVFSGGLSRAAGENVASYAIGQGTLGAGGNYIISYSGADFTINPVAVAEDISIPNSVERISQDANILIWNGGIKFVATKRTVRLRVIGLNRGNAIPMASGITIADAVAYNLPAAGGSRPELDTASPAGPPLHVPAKSKRANRYQDRK